MNGNPIVDERLVEAEELLNGSPATLGRLGRAIELLWFYCMEHGTQNPALAKLITAVYTNMPMEVKHAADAETTARLSAIVEKWQRNRPPPVVLKTSNEDIDHAQNS